MQEKTFEPEVVNKKISSIVLISMFTIWLPFFFIYLTSMKELIKGVNLLILLPAILAGLLIHEVIHGIFFAMYTPKRFKAIRFGVIWKAGMFYCHCTEALPIRGYRVSLLMPTVILGVIPALMGYIWGDLNYLIFGILLFTGGAGDIFMFIQLKDLSKKAIVKDHPDKIGCYYSEPDDLD